LKVGLFHPMAGHWAVACRELNLDIEWAYENLKLPLKYFKLNFPDIPIINDLDSLTPVDVVMGSPPCIGVSKANPAACPSHPANLEILRFAEAVRRLKPYAFIMEMVPRFKTSPIFRDLRNRYLSYLKDYHIISPIVDLAEYRSPCHRKRVFYVGYNHKLLVVPTFPKPAGRMTVREAFKGLPRLSEEEALEQGLTRKFNPKWLGPYRTLAKNPQYYQLPWDGQGGVLTAVGGQYFKHPDGHRLITKREAARLMGLPDWFKLPESFSTAIKICAWGVPVYSLVIIIRHLMEELSYALKRLLRMV